MSIADNIIQIREKIAEAAIKSGRKPEDIKLVAAAKTNSAENIRQAILAGVDAVGENRVQEMLAKNEENAYVGAPLHFIGHLQSNKVGKVVGLCDLIESVDSTSLIEQIGRKAVSLGIVQNILIEVNIGKESQKSGIMPEQTAEVLEFASKVNGINVLGLMTIPPFFEENEKNSVFFDSMYKLFVDIRAKKYDNVSMRFLSMGMSDSYIEAILAGSNVVRIGSSIFGSRYTF